MTRVGYKPEDAHKTWVKINRWQSVNREEVKYVMGLNWFRMQGLVFLHDFTK